MSNIVFWSVFAGLLFVAGPLRAQDATEGEEFEVVEDSEIIDEPQQRTPGSSRFTLTAERLYDESRGQLDRMRKILAAHKKLEADAKRTGLIVAMDAVSKDFNAGKELYFLAQQLLEELAGDLSMDDPKSRQVLIDDPLMYPQVKEIRILSDQAEQLYRAGKRFLASMQKPTELKVTRIGEGSDEDL